MKTIMNFSMTEKQKMIQRITREFSEEFIVPIAEESDKNSQLDIKILNLMKKMNFFGLCIPKEFGGAGLHDDTVSFCIIVEEIAKIDASYALTPGVHCSVVARPIYIYGTEEQRRKFLIPLVKGDKIGAFALTEANAGSDVASIETNAVIDGDEWVLNGNKIFITNGGIAKTIIVLAKTGEKGKRKFHTLFIVDADTPGFSVGVKEDKLGVRASNTTELVFQDMRIPHENILGEVGNGLKIALEILNFGRIIVAAQCVGLGQGAMESAIKYANEREQFGSNIGRFQGIQWRIADMGCAVESARLLTQKAAHMCDNNMDYSLMASMAKLVASEVAMKVAHDAVQIHGGYGLMKAYPVERYFRDAKMAEIYEGTSEIQRMVIAKQLLKKFV